MIPTSLHKSHQKDGKNVKKRNKVINWQAASATDEGIVLTNYAIPYVIERCSIKIASIVWLSRVRVTDLQP